MRDSNKSISRILSRSVIATALILLLTLNVLSIVPVMAQAPAITPSPTSGPPGTSVTIDGSGFTPGASGVVWFDTNNNGAVDAGEPSVPATADGSAFSVTLTVPDVTARSYNIRADVPLGGAVEASATFTVSTPSISITPTSGSPGTSITVVGTNFKLGATVTIFFDIDNDGQPDPGEVVGTATASNTGAFSKVVTVPTIPGRTYDVRATDGVNTAAAVQFTITPAITLSPNTGPAGATITVTGAGFAANTPYDIWYDTDGTGGQVDAGDTKLADVTTGPDGTFTASVTIPIGATTDLVMVIGDDQTGDPLASATFTVISPGITLTPNSGPPGTSVTIDGSGFTPGASGVVWFDTDGDGVVDAGEPSASVTANAAGEFTANLNVPTVPYTASGYSIRADVPSGGTVEASATFTVTPAITRSPPSGPPETTVTITGSGFASSASGVVWFDTNNNGAVDAGEPSASVTASPLGTFTATLTIPTVAGGLYYIRADVPSGGAVEAFATFTVISPAITLTPTSGPPGTSISISGTNFLAGASGFVWFDIDGDSIVDPGEPSATITTDATGAFTATLTVPTVAGVTYNVRADIPSGGAVEAFATFIVTPVITLSPTTGSPGTSVTVTGSGFAPSTLYRVYFDIDGDSVWDSGEPYDDKTSTSLGTFTATLTVPTVAAGNYYIRADDTWTVAPAIASESFTVVIPTITVSPTAVECGQLITILGSGFTPGASGIVWFDTDGDGIVDLGEPHVPVTVSSAGTFITTLTAPDVPAGPYWIRADIPSGLPVEASTQILIVAPGFTTILNAINEIKNKLGTFTGTDTVASLLYDIEGKLNAIKQKTDALPVFGNLVTKNWTDLTGYIDSAKSAIIAAMPDLTPIEGKLDAIEDKLDDAARWVSDADLSSAVSTITSAISGLDAKLGTFTGTDNVASLLYDIKGKLNALPAWGDLVTKNWADLTGYIDSAVSGAVNSIAGSVSSAKSDIILAINSTKDEILTAIQGIDLRPVLNATNAIEGKLDAIEGKLDALPAWGNLVTKNWTDLTGYIDNAVGTITNAISGLDAKLSAVKAKTDTINWADITAIRAVVDAVKQKIDTINWADIIYIKGKVETVAGKVETVAQATSNGGSTTFTSTRTQVLYVGAKVGTVTVSIKTVGVSAGERLSIRYYTDPSNPTIYIEKNVALGVNTPGWTDTAAAWKVELAYTWSSGTDIVYWSYSVIYPQ
jgi:hypothetical protein